MMLSGLPSLRACSVRIARSFSTSALSSSAVVVAFGFIAATCMAMPLASSSLPPSTYEQHAALGVVMDIAAGRGIDADECAPAAALRASCLRSHPSTAGASCPCGSAPAASTAPRASLRRDRWPVASPDRWPVRRRLRAWRPAPIRPAARSSRRRGGFKRRVHGQPAFLGAAILPNGHDLLARFAEPSAWPARSRRSVSCSAFLQSIIGRPVSSRSFMTIAAVISAMGNS